MRAGIIYTGYNAVSVENILITSHKSLTVIARCRFLAIRPHGNFHVVQLGDHVVGPSARRTRNVPRAVGGMRIAIIFFRRRKMAVVHSLAEKLAFLVLALRGTGGNQPALLVTVRGGAVVLGNFVAKEFPVFGTKKQFSHPASLFEECTLLDAIEGQDDVIVHRGKSRNVPRIFCDTTGSCRRFDETILDVCFDVGVLTVPSLGQNIAAGFIGGIGYFLLFLAEGFASSVLE